MKTLLPVLAAVVAVGTTVVAPAQADSPPVGALPKGPVSEVTTTKGALVAVALPVRPNGLVWRLARPLNPRVVRQVSEATVDRSVVVVFRATGRGRARIVFALTRGETARAYASNTHRLTVK
jgi:hypothetical protein